MPITHIVLFQFKAGTSPDIIKDVCSELCIRSDRFERPWLYAYQDSDVDTNNDTLQICSRMLGLKDTCLHPSSQKPYIRTSSGGIDDSPEGIQVCYPCVFYK